jgi:hypothetical protein
MIVGKKFAYIHLQKTAGTFISGELLRCLPDSQSIGKKHSGIQDLNKKQIQLLIIGSIRHPVDFYVSLWKYGCEGKGGLYHRLVKSNSNISSVFKQVKSNSWSFLKNKHILKKSYPWKEFYSDSQKIDNFQKWYTAIHSFNSHLDLGTVPTKNSELGFYTNRYLKQYYTPSKSIIIQRKSNNTESKSFGSEIKIPNTFRCEVSSKRMVDYFIRQEYLNEDFNQVIELLRKSGERISDEFKIKTDKVNQTQQSSLRYIDFYSPELLNQVLIKDKIIIDKHYSK